MKVSIVMPAHNAGRYMEAAARSVTAQSFGDWELLVIDDGSADNTAVLAQSFAEKDDRIRLLRNERNLGAALSRNRGIAAARGEWIAFLDSDDLWMPDKLEKQLALIAKHPDAALTYTASTFIDENGRPYPYIQHAEERTDYQALLRHNLMSCSSVMARRELLLRYPFPSGALHEDYAVWLQMLREIPCAYGLDEPLLRYRLSKASRSGGRVRSAEMIYRTYRHVGYHAAASAWLTLRYLPYSVAKRRGIRRSRKRKSADR